MLGVCVNLGGCEDKSDTDSDFQRLSANSPNSLVCCECSTEIHMKGAQKKEKELLLRLLESTHRDRALGLGFKG